MATEIFVNLPVKDLNKTVEFFTKLGFKFNPQYTDENATCMIVGEDSYVMLLVEKFFKTFTSREISDSKKYIEVITSPNIESRAKVDEMVDKAMQAGAGTAREPEEYPYMYVRSFHDLDGHLWEIGYMDHEAISKKP